MTPTHDTKEFTSILEITEESDTQHEVNELFENFKRGCRRALIALDINKVFKRNIESLDSLDDGDVVEAIWTALEEKENFLEVGSGIVL